MTQHGKRLTVTKVVFELSLFLFLAVNTSRLTVTKVVFEFFNTAIALLISLGLTVTKVVFEFMWIFYIFYAYCKINSNKGCF